MLANAAKQSVPRGYQKNYIPCLDEECQQLYEHHTAATSSEGSEASANILIKRLDEKRQERWIETVESIDFTHSSGKAWYTINRITGRTASKPDKCPMSASAIALQLLKNSSFTNPDRDFSTQVGKEVAGLWKIDSKDVNMSTPFTTEELVEALKSMKAEKALVADDIHREFHLHAGMLQKSGCVIICLPVWKDVKSPESGARNCHRPSES